MIEKVARLLLACICMVCLAVSVSAAGQGTDGTELQLIQPQNLEIHLGESWAGAEFQLQTDVGMYPGVITVGADGVLQMEIGGSENYILSYLNSSVEIPVPGDTVVPGEEPGPSDDPSDCTEPAETSGEEQTAPTEIIPEEPEEGTLAGIPVKHIVLFGLGLIGSICALVGIRFCQKRSSRSGNDADEDEI